MINETLPITKKEAGESKPLPENIYQVQLLDVTSKNDESYDSKEARKKDPALEPVMEDILSFQFVLLSGKENGESLRGRSTWANFVPTYLYISRKNGKNKLYQIVEALLGDNLSPEQEAKMDGAFINSLVGKQCRIGIKNKQSGDKVYSNIETYYPSEMDMNALTDEEKAKATVGKKDEPQKSVNEEYNEMNDIINPDDIPF